MAHMIGTITIIRDKTDEYGCVNLTLRYDPNSKLGDHREYSAGVLYLRESEADHFIQTMQDQDLWNVRVI